VIDRQFIQQRAEFRCEYCRLNQRDAPFAAFHVEHVVPRKHAGSDEIDNLAWACFHCNHRKGTNLTGIDPETGLITPDFNPRRDSWDEHFRRDQYRLVGISSIGRTTVAVLAMNAPDRVDLRQTLQ
jgi:5-methylcytosine-specific restriction endonuclease McrA